MRETTKPLWEKKFPHVPFEFHDVNSYKELNPPENSKSSATGTYFTKWLANTCSIPKVKIASLIVAKSSNLIFVYR